MELPNLLSVLLFHNSQSLTPISLPLPTTLFAFLRHSPLHHAYVPLSLPVSASSHYCLCFSPVLPSAWFFLLLYKRLFPIQYYPQSILYTIFTRLVLIVLHSSFSLPVVCKLSLHIVCSPSFYFFFPRNHVIHQSTHLFFSPYYLNDFPQYTLLVESTKFLFYF